MGRVLLQVVLPFLAPFILFGLYRLLVTRGRAVLERTPWFLLTVSGIVLACGSLVALALVGGDPPGGSYVPPRIEDGRIVPGEVKPP
jgi:hypothetical protein